MLHLLENWSLILLLFLLWCGVLFMLNVCTVVDRGWCVGLVVAVLCSNLLYLLSTAQACCKAFFQRNKRNVQKLVKGVKGIAGKIGHGRRKDAGGTEFEQQQEEVNQEEGGLIELELPPAVSIKVHGDGIGDGIGEGVGKGGEKKVSESRLNERIDMTFTSSLAARPLEEQHPRRVVRKTKRPRQVGEPLAGGKVVETPFGRGKVLYVRKIDSCQVVELPWKLARGSKALLYRYPG